MSSKINIEYKGKGCVPQEVLVRYLKGMLTGTEMNSVERHLSGCPMCTDAMEGLGLLESPESIFAISEKLNNQIDNNISEGKKGFWLNTPFRIAASVTIIVALSGLLYLTSTLNTPSNILSEQIGSSGDDKSQELIFEEEKEFEDSLNDVEENEAPDVKPALERPINTEQEKTKAGAPPPPKPAALKSIRNNIVIVEDADIDESLDLFAEEFKEDVAVRIVAFANDDEEVNEEEIFVIVEEMPTFRGGDINKFRDYINENLKYPLAAAESGIQGRVILSFVIEPTGKVSNVKVLRGVDPLLDKEAIRVVESSPEWNPGRQRGKPVRVSFNIPVIFVLN
ncbi:MAG: TonB family protein [Tenuifilaceae bacterium]|jgi:protein TonB|nr:TonB family protein [Tenuifilaceae bacterium]